MQPQQLPQVYGAAAWTYVQRGWLGVLPLPPGAKTEPPSGFTGETGRYPTQADVQRWVSTHPGGNIALRLSDTTLGLDVDAYEGRLGGQTLAGLEAQLGQLPPTWVSTSREDGSGSGIRIFRVPGGLTWRNDIGADIDVIRRSWRYAVVWPSTHPKTRATYRWYAPGWIPAVTPPSEADLATLPFPWVQFLTEKPEAKKTKIRSSLNSDDFFDPPISFEEANRRIRMRLDLVTDHARRGWAGFRDTLRDSSYDIGGFVGGGHLTYDDAQFALTQAIVNGGHFPNQDDLLWIQQGLDDGSSVPWKVAKLVSRPKDRTGGTGQDDKKGKPRRLPLIPDQVWERRSWLRAIRDRAQEIAAVPDATLGAALGIYASSLPHNIAIRTGIQYDLGPSLLVGVVSGSGLGKSSGWKLARRELAPVETPRVMSTPTGEGLIEELMGWVTKETMDRETAKLKKVKEHKQVKNNALFNVGEGEAMSLAMERSGATLGPVLRLLFSGEDLSTTNATEERKRYIPAGSYSIGVVVLYQETTAMKIINDTDTGTAQRFLWFSGHSPSALPTGSQPLTRMPAPHITHLEQETGLNGEIVYVLRVDPAITERLRAEDAKKRDTYSLGDINRDSQKPAVIAKVAAIACLVEDRTMITLDDWALAEDLYAASKAIQDELIDFAEEQDRSKRREVAAKAGEADHVRKSFRTEVSKVAWALTEKITALGRPATRRELTLSVSSKRRAYLAEALEMATLETGWIREADGKFELGPTPLR
jgi:hypothetical protein